MNVQVLIQGHQRLPATKPFAVTQPKQLEREPNSLGIRILVDGNPVPGGEAMIGKIEPGRYGSVVPIFVPLTLALGPHTLELRNTHTLPEHSNVSYGDNHYYSVVLLEY
jgi:hypothetical protein